MNIKSGIFLIKPAAGFFISFTEQPTEVSVLNIRIITSAVLGTVLSFALPAASYAEDNVIRDGGTVIYTDGFKVVSSSSAGQQMTADISEGAGSPSLLGTLGKKNVVTGDKAKGHIAFVTKNTGRSYIIRDELIVTCVKKNPDCLKDMTGAEKFSRRYYKVKAHNYAEWLELRESLEARPDVVKVSPSIDYGNRVKLH